MSVTARSFAMHRDAERGSRGSEGVAFVIMPGGEVGHIYFYCWEYGLCWDSFEEVGVGMFPDPQPDGLIEPATLVQICEAGLSSKVDFFYGVTRDAGSQNWRIERRVEAP